MFCATFVSLVTVFFACSRKNSSGIEEPRTEHPRWKVGLVFLDYWKRILPSRSRKVFFLEAPGFVGYFFTFLQAFEEWGDWPEDDDWSDDIETPVRISTKE